MSNRAMKDATSRARRRRAEAEQRTQAELEAAVRHAYSENIPVAHIARETKLSRVAVRDVLRRKG